MTTRTMRAIVQHGYGGTEVLSNADVAVPSPGPKQVLVKVYAVSPDSGTVHLMTGRPTLVRPFIGWRTPRQPIIGLAFAGVVMAVGSAVETVRIGDRVAGSAPAAFADYVVADPAKIAVVPPEVSMIEAATVPISAGTALQAVRDVARIQAGQRVLVIGAGGGVGSFLTQLAVLAGASVTGVASAAKAALVRSLGAERVIDYRENPEPADWGEFDVIIDTADGRPLHVLRRALAERGALVIVGADGAGGPVLDGVDRQLRAALLSPWVKHRLVGVVQSERGSDVAVLLDHLARGEITASVGEMVPFDAARESIRRLQERTISGKAVIELRAEDSER